MPLHLDEFQREAFQGYIEDVPPARTRVLASLMPSRPIHDIKFSYNVINGVYAQMAAITGFNAGAPLRDKKGLERLFGEVAKIQHGFKLDEEELLKFNKPRDDAERDEVIDYVYDQTDEMLEGVRDSEEYLRAQAIYQGKIEYKVDDVVITFDLDIPAANKVTATKLWSDPASTPLTDLQTLKKQYKKMNKQKTPAALHMSEALFSDLLTNNQIRLNVYGENTSSARVVTGEQVRTLFTALGLPPIVINDDIVGTDAGEVRLLPERRAVFVATDLGKTFIGITVENNYKPGVYVVPEIKETNPPMQAVYVGETAFPALQKPNAVAWIDA